MSNGHSNLTAESSATLFIDPTSPQIHQAAAFGNVDELERELAIGWHVDMTDNYGRTALHHAALNGNLEACTVLINRGARLDARARDGKTPFNYAAQNCKADALRLLDTTARRARNMNREGAKKDGPMRERAFTVDEDVSSPMSADPFSKPISGRAVSSSSGHSRHLPANETPAANSYRKPLSPTTSTILHDHTPPQHGPDTDGPSQLQSPDGVGVARREGRPTVGLTSGMYILNDRLIKEARDRNGKSRKSPGSSELPQHEDLYVPSPPGLQASPNTYLPKSVQSRASSSSLRNRVTWRDEFGRKAEVGRKAEGVGDEGEDRAGVQLEANEALL